MGAPLLHFTNGATNVAKCCHLPELTMVLFAVFVIIQGANLADVAILKKSKCDALKFSTFPAGVLLPFAVLQPFPKLDMLLFTALVA